VRDRDIVRGRVMRGAMNAGVYVYENSDAAHNLDVYVGSTRNFQYWYRNLAAGGAYFNTSNAISIAILL
jgi:hypothetical protein